MKQYIQISPSDNVAVALATLPEGTVVEIGEASFSLVEQIPAGHKFALEALQPGREVIKYGSRIGVASSPIPRGGWVNEKNIHTCLAGVQTYAYHPVPLAEARCHGAPPVFMGYRRSDGNVGIRNEIWIIPTVGCVNGIAGKLAALLETETGGEGVDAIRAFTHNYGCSQLGDDHENTRKILRNMVLHPNAGAVLIVGLGCENNRPEAFREMLGEYDTSRIRLMVCQEVDDEIACGMSLLREMYAIAREDKRTPVPLSALRVGLKCGGSDGFSGITANPLLGAFSDRLVALGGTTVLTEVPEMFGAETLLMDRCATRELFEKTVAMINGFKDYFIRQGQPVYENPSPGNKAGGISTLEEKSLGCTQKAGTSAVRDVLAYGDRLSRPGLNLLSAPGNDLVAATALAAAGCQLVLFTTGRGTPFGTFVPTLKVSTNSHLYRHKSHWIDFNAGTLLEEDSLDSLCDRFVQFVCRVAGGQPTCNESRGDSGFAIFKTGVTL